MDNPLYIVGTTGTGKTALATRLANTTPTILVSADSRQLYRGMDIVTGKDHPKDHNLVGVDLADPDVEYSVSQWYDAVKPIYSAGLRSGKQVVVVGGTGLYVRALIDDGSIQTLAIPQNPALRTRLMHCSTHELQDLLKTQGPHVFARLNHSDQNNPRRLVRALEVLSYNPNISYTHNPSPTQQLHGLYYKDINLQQKVIRERVYSRIEQGAILETKQLLTRYSPSLQSFSALGYLLIKSYLQGDISKKVLVENWTNAELSYAKRQYLYFRKMNIIWYDRGRMSLEDIYEHISR